MLPLIVVYNASSIGSIAGGWLSGSLIHRGWSLNSARKTAMLVCGLSVLPVLYAPYCTNLWVVVGLVSLATAVHQGWSANLFTLASDLFPRAAVGSVVGIGGTAGSLGGVLVQIATGYIVQLTHSYLPLFMFAGSGYLIALGIVHLLSPKLAPVDL
jgi:ACS family hexuronate transporter-like MFS transporter